MDDYERTWDEDEEYGLHDIDVLELGGTLDDLPGDHGGGGDGAKRSANPVYGGPQVVKKNPYLAEVNKRWGPDHPHAFAKGCADSVVPTPLGSAGDAGQWATAESEAAKGQQAEEPAFVASGWAGPAFGTIPFTRAKGTAAPGASPLAEPEVEPVAAAAAVVAVAAAADDAGVHFEASSVFAGAREGLGFRAGSQGLGYYRLATQHS